MRNAKGKDERGRTVLGKSKGFGFVQFGQHVEALTCLRNLNNNSEAFSDVRVSCFLFHIGKNERAKLLQRPIVEFAIENHNAFRIQEKRRAMIAAGGAPDIISIKKAPTLKVRRSKPTIDTPKSVDELAIQRTKRTIDKSGLKALPKKFGKKVRHRDSKVNKRLDLVLA